MKPFERYRKVFDYPQDMERIIRYLGRIGEIKVSPETLQKLYREFSNEKYCAGWMLLSAPILEEFANWLENYEFRR